jgi:DNA-binding response OmpR family regulator
MHATVTSMTSRALVVCSSDDVRRTIDAVLRAAGFEAIDAVDGESALYVSGQQLLDAVLIVAPLPGIGAEELCRELRRRGRMAIIAISGGAESRRISALAAGADDHVDLPFDANELEARLRAVVRRTTGSLAVERRVRVGPVVIRVAHGSATIVPTEADLDAEDATVLAALAEHPGFVIAREALRERLAARHGADAADHLDDYVARLAGVLEAAGAPAVHIVQGDGVVLQPE